MNVEKRYFFKLFITDFINVIALRRAQFRVLALLYKLCLALGILMFSVKY